MTEKFKSCTIFNVVAKCWLARGKCQFDIPRDVAFVCSIVLHSCESKCFQRLHFVLPIFGIANWRSLIDNVNFSYAYLEFTGPKAPLLSVLNKKIIHISDFIINLY